MDFVNLRLMSHPLNWFFVWAILALWAIAYHQVKSALDQAATDGSISPD